MTCYLLKKENKKESTYPEQFLLFNSFFKFIFTNNSSPNLFSNLMLLTMSPSLEWQTTLPLDLKKKELDLLNRCRSLPSIEFHAPNTAHTSRLLLTSRFLMHKTWDKNYFFSSNCTSQILNYTVNLLFVILRYGYLVSKGNLSIYRLRIQ